MRSFMKKISAPTTLSKRILYIGDHLSSKNGGYPSVAESLAPHLLPELSLRLISRERRRIPRLIDMVFSVLKYGRKEQPVTIDVYSTLNFYYALLCANLCRLLGIKYFCILHGGNLPNRLSANPVLCRSIFGHAAKLVSPSTYLQSEFFKYGYEAIVIPNIIYIDNYKFLERDQIKPRLLWVRAFHATYNPSMAIRLVHSLVDTYPEITMCMVGPDKDGSMEICKNLARELRVDKHIIFKGQLSKAEWRELASNYDLFINTTNFDNMPVSVLEAMALGIPVVSTDAGGLPHLIKHEVTGLLTQTNNIEEMTDAVIKLISNPELTHRISCAGRKQAESFSPNVVKAKWLKLYFN